MTDEPCIPISELRKIIDKARYAEDIESDLVELVNRYPIKEEQIK